MRILVVGAGVIGSVYAARLLEAGHTVTVCARGRRLRELWDGGLILRDAETGRRTAHKVGAVATWWRRVTSGRGDPARDESRPKIMCGGPDCILSEN
jgi:nucleoside-diphosphate-sugar epimerase